MLSRLLEKMLTGDRRSLARLLTLLEDDGGNLPAIVRAVYSSTGRAYCIGITGPPGAGKSTVVDGLIRVMRENDLAVGVLALDPTSPFSGGAVLGDRIRMQRHYLDRGVFIRSLATRGSRGGLSRVAGAAVKILDAFGLDIVIVETVGVGQTELDIVKVADTTVVVLVPEAGDSVQAMKAGLMEIADIFVVNKADRDGADRLATAIEGMLHLGDGDAWWRPPVLLSQAHRGVGIEALYDETVRHRDEMVRTSRLEQRRRGRSKQELFRTLSQTVEAGIAAQMSHNTALRELVERVENGELDPYTAAAKVLEEGLLER